MRIVMVAALLAAVGCKKDTPPGSPGAPDSTTEQDELWAMAPEGAKFGIVASARAVAMAENAWGAVRTVMSANEDLEKYDDELGKKLKKAVGTSDPTLADLGLTHDKGGAVFYVADKEVVVVVPLADRDKFLETIKGKKGDDVDKTEKGACKTIKGHYVCAEPARLLDTVGKGDLRKKLDDAGARGDIEAAGEPPDSSGKSPTFAVVAQLARGAMTFRGTIDGLLPDSIAKKMRDVANKPRTEDGNSGFTMLDPRPFLADLGSAGRERIVSGVTLGDLAEAVDGPITMTSWGGKDVGFDIRIPLDATGAAKKLVSHCDELRPLRGIATVDDDVCHLEVPTIDVDLDAWVDGKELRIGKKKGRGKSIAMSPLGEEIAKGEWAFAMWGRGTMLSAAGILPLGQMLPARGKDAELGFLVMSWIHEFGVAARVEGKSVKFVAGVRTGFANPDDVVKKLAQIGARELVRKKAAETGKDIADDASGSPFATDFAAGPSGVTAMFAPVGILAATAIPAFLQYSKKSKPTEALLQLKKIERNAKTAFITDSTFPKGTVGLTPQTDCCTDNFGGRRKCGPNPQLWADPTWRALDFEIDEPHLFQYSYQSDGQTLTAKAVGDLDCDGIAITYTLTGRIENGNAVFEYIEPPPNSD